MDDDYIPFDILQELQNANISLSDFVNITMSDILDDTKTSVIVSRHRIWPCFFWITFCVGMIGNWLVIYILLRNKNLRTVTNVFLLNLAIADILYLFITIPNTSFWTDYWPHGEFMCKFIHYLMGVTMAVSVLSLTAVGLDRHYAILYPVSSRQHRTLKKTVVMIVIFWWFSFIISSPSIIIAKKLDVFGEDVCVSYWKEPWEHKAYSVSMFLLLYVIPQLILGVCYFRIGKKLWFSMRMRPHGRTNAKSVQTLQTRRRVVKVVIIVTACFAVCWLPVHLVELYIAYGKQLKSKVFYDIKLLAPLIPHLFIATNPIMYCFMSKTFRLSFKAAFTCNNKLFLISAVDSHAMSMSRNYTENRWHRSKSGSEVSYDVSNHELMERVVSVDKAVNTSPRLQKMERNGNQTSSSSIENNSSNSQLSRSENV